MRLADEPLDSGHKVTDAGQPGRVLAAGVLPGCVPPGRGDRRIDQGGGGGLRLIEMPARKVTVLYLVQGEPVSQVLAVQHQVIRCPAGYLTLPGDGQPLLPPPPPVL